MKYLIQRLDKTIKSFTSFTRYSLIILVLLTMSCTDKKQITEPVVVEDSNEVFTLNLNIDNIPTLYSISLDMVSTDSILVDTNTNLILSYGLTPELYMLEYRAESLLGYGYNKELIDDDTDTDKFTNGQISNNIYYTYDSGYYNVYEAVYYDPKNNEYYYVNDMEVHSNVPPITAFDTNFVEPLFFSSEQITNTSSIIYIGDLSSNQRLFYKPDNNIYLVKTLNKIVDDHVSYVYFLNSYEPGITNLAMSTPVYPAFDGYMGISYTNNEGIHFERGGYTGGSLSTADTNFSEGQKFERSLSNDTSLATAEPDFN